MQEAWERTREIARALRASIALFQCPARFTPTTLNVANLRRFFTKIKREGLRFAWEPREGPRRTTAIRRCLMTLLIRFLTTSCS